MSRTLQAILTATGPTLSSTVVRELEKDAVAPATARQRIARAVREDSIQALRGVSFPNRERFLFLKSQHGTEPFVTSLKDALVQQGTCYGRALSGLDARGGATYAHYFPIASGLPMTIAKRQVLHSTVEERLRQIRLITTADVIGGHETVVLQDSDGMNPRRRAVLLAEDILLASIRAWLMRTGWSSEHAPKIRCLEKDLPQIGQFAWDLSAPTYLAAFRKDPKDKGFIAGDVILGRTISLPDLTPFFAKCAALTAQKRKQQFQPFLIADGIASDALQRLRERGILILMPATVFGEQAAADLRDLISTVANAATKVTRSPEAAFEMLNRLSKIEGAAGNLRGVVLELLVARIHGADGFQTSIRKIVGPREGRAEIDVLATKSAEVICCECKGVAPSNLVGVDVIDDWYERSRPIIKEWLKNQNQQNRHYEFYSSTGYTPEAQGRIRELQKKHKKAPLEFYEGTDIVRKLQAMGDQKLVEIYREQFRPEDLRRPPEICTTAPAVPEVPVLADERAPTERDASVWSGNPGHAGPDSPGLFSRDLARTADEVKEFQRGSASAAIP